MLFEIQKINSTLVKKYLWQGLTRLLAIYDADDNILMRFEYADSRLPVAMQSGGATYCLAYDQVDSLRIVTDASGTVIKALDYDSFGNIIQDTNPSFDMPFGFAGGLYDSDTGLVRFGFREYSPEIGRWTAKDPILFLGGDTDLYEYCLDDPVSLVDPLGLWQIKIMFYRGYGGAVTFGRADGKSFIRATGGVGLGIGIKFYPAGKFPVPSACGPAGFLGASANLGVTIGPISGEYKGELGLGITKGPDGKPQLQYIEQGGFEGSLKGTDNWGLSAGGGVGVDVGVAW